MSKDSDGGEIFVGELCGFFSGIDEVERECAAPTFIGRNVVEHLLVLARDLCDPLVARDQGAGDRRHLGVGGGPFTSR